MNKIVFLFFLLIVMLLSLNAQAQCLKTNVEGIEINGKEFKKSYKVFVSIDEKWIEAERTITGFIIPKEFKDEEKLNVRFVFGKYQLDFSKVHISKFDADWLIGIDDAPPFSEEYVLPEESQNLKRIYYITFKSKKGLDTVLLIKETRGSIKSCGNGKKVKK